MTTEKKRPLLALKPRFAPKTAVAEAILPSLLGTVIGTVAGGTFFYILFSIIGLTKFVSVSAIYTVFFLLSLTLLPAAFYEVKRRALSQTVYLFYSNHLEFQNFQFYINRRRGRVRYDDINDVFMKSGWMQGLSGLTTLYLFVPTMGVEGGFSGLRIKDIPDDRRIASKIMAIVERTLEAETPATARAQAATASPV